MARPRTQYEATRKGLEEMIRRKCSLSKDLKAGTLLAIFALYRSGEDEAAEALWPAPDTRSEESHP